MKNKEKYIDDIIEVMKDCSKECHFRAKRMFRNKDGECPSEMGCPECNVKFYEWLEEEYEPPKVDWNSVPMNTIIEVRDYEDASWTKRIFVWYNENSDYPYVCIGNTKYNYGLAVSWKYARLLEEN
jgi:hypothetical protein